MLKRGSFLRSSHDVRNMGHLPLYRELSRSPPPRSPTHAVTGPRRVQELNHGIGQTTRIAGLEGDACLAFNNSF